MHANAEIIMVHVNYDRPLPERIREAGFDYVDPYITAKNFPTRREGKAEVGVVIVPMHHVMTTEEVTELHRSLGLRPADIHMLLALGTAFPNLQRSYPIVAFGSSCIEQEGPPSVPVLRCLSDGKRQFFLDWTGHRWSGDHRILAIRS